MLRRPSAPRARRILRNVVKGVTRALGFGAKKPSVNIQVDTGASQLARQMAQQEAARAATQATQMAQERLAQERAATLARAAGSALEDDDEFGRDLTRRRKGIVL